MHFALIEYYKAIEIGDIVFHEFYTDKGTVFYIVIVGTTEKLIESLQKFCKEKTLRMRMDQLNPLFERKDVAHLLASMSCIHELYEETTKYLIHTFSKKLEQRNVYLL